MTRAEFDALFVETRRHLFQKGYVFSDDELNIDKEFAQIAELRETCKKYGKIFPEDSDPLTYDLSTFDMEAFIIGSVEAGRPPKPPHPKPPI